MFKTINSEFYIDRIGFIYDQRFGESFIYPGESHNFTEIGYVLEGAVEMVSGENVYIMSEGDIIFHRPMVFHKLKTYGRSSLRLLNLSFLHCGIIQDVIYNGVYSLEVDERRNFEEIFDLARDFMRNENADDIDGQEVSERLSSFIIRLCKRKSGNDNLSPEHGAMIFRKLVSFMNDNIERDISIAELAESCHISISYVKQLFAKYSDVSPKNYFLHLRASLAAKMISSGMSVCETAERMGFSSPNYFSLFFKKQHGVTPRDYKNNFR